MRVLGFVWKEHTGMAHLLVQNVRDSGNMGSFKSSKSSNLVKEPREELINFLLDTWSSRS